MLINYSQLVFCFSTFRGRSGPSYRLPFHHHPHSRLLHFFICVARFNTTEIVPHAVQRSAVLCIVFCGDILRIWLKFCADTFQKQQVLGEIPKSLPFSAQVVQGCDGK